MKVKFEKAMLLLLIILLGVLTFTLAPKLYKKAISTAVEASATAIRLDGTINRTELKLPNPEPKTDIYTPLRQQYDKSRHTQSLKVLNDQKEIPGNHVVDSCFKCHSYEYDIAPENNKPSTQSLTTSITCGTCHSMNAEGYFIIRNNSSPTEVCSTCHVAANIEPGIAVYNSQSNMYKGIGALGILAMPDKRYIEKISCADCHMANQDHSFEATLPSQALKDKTIAACYLCHATENDQEFASHVDQIQTDFKNEAKTLDDRLATDSRKLAIMKDAPNYNQTKQLIDVVITNLSFVENDKSWGVHNLDYTRAIMNDLQEKLALVESLIN